MQWKKNQKWKNGVIEQMFSDHKMHKISRNLIYFIKKSLCLL